MVWTSVEWDAVGGCGVGVWGCGGGGVDTEEGEDGEGEEEERERIVKCVAFRRGVSRDLLHIYGRKWGYRSHIHCIRNLDR